MRVVVLPNSDLSYTAQNSPDYGRIKRGVAAQVPSSGQRSPLATKTIGGVRNPVGDRFAEWTAPRPFDAEVATTLPGSIGARSCRGANEVSR